MSVAGHWKVGAASKNIPVFSRCLSLSKQVDPTSTQEDNSAGRVLYVTVGGFLPQEVLTHHGLLATG